MENYRIVKQPGTTGPVYSLHRVELNEQGKVTAVDPNPFAPAANSVQDLATVLIYMNRAFTEAIVDHDLPSSYQTAQDLFNAKL